MKNLKLARAHRLLLNGQPKEAIAMAADAVDDDVSKGRALDLDDVVMVRDILDAAKTLVVV